MYKVIKRVIAVCFSFLLLSIGRSNVYAQVDPNLSVRLQQSPIIVNRNSIALFEQIPDFTTTDSNGDCIDDSTGVISYFCKAEKIRLIFGNRSVGVTTNDALNCFEAPSSSQASFTCTKLVHNDPSYNLSPEYIYWSRTGGYNRANWIHEGFASTWYTMTNDYITLLDNNQVQGGRSLNNFDVYTFQFSYLNVMDGDSIANLTSCGGSNQPRCGFFYNNSSDKTDVYDLDRRLVAHSNKYFVFQTTSLARSIGTQVSTNFNNQMRQFINSGRDSNGRYRILLDFADVEATLPDGRECYDNRDGVLYCQNTSVCENWPDDRINQPAICQHYTVETENGHFSMGAANVRIAKAYWVLMAQLAGWVPGSTQSTPTPTPAVTNTPTPTATRTPTPTPTTVLVQGDANGDGRVDGVDYIIWLNHFNQTTSQGRVVGDFNSSGRVDGADYVIWMSNYH